MYAKKLANAAHANGLESTLSHRTLKARVGSAFVAGCLALTLCPTAAFAAPGNDQGGPQQQGNPPALHQDNQAPSHQAPDSQAPDGQNSAGQPPAGQPQADRDPSNQAPNAQQGPKDNERGNSDAFDDQVRSVLSDEYNLDTTAPTGNGKAPDATDDTAQGNRPDNLEEAPELPAGAVNIQRAIDTVRSIFFKYSTEDLQANIGDADFAEQLKACAKSAIENQLAMFANGTKPTGNAADNSAKPTGQPAANNGSPSQPSDNGSAQPSANNDGAGNAETAKPAELNSLENISTTLIGQVMSVIADVIGLANLV